IPARVCNTIAEGRYGYSYRSRTSWACGCSHYADLYACAGSAICRGTKPTLIVRKINMPFRIGHRYDVHRFGTGNELLIGGVRIPFIRAVIAHSDGDVLQHALCDALLGAAGLGDIGRHFPDTDAQYKGADSRE